MWELPHSLRVFVLLLLLPGIVHGSHSLSLPVQDIRGGSGVLLASVRGDIEGGSGILIVRDTGGDIEGGRGGIISSLSRKRQKIQRLLAATLRRRPMPSPVKPTVADMVEAALAQADKALKANPPRVDVAKASYRRAAELGDWRGPLELGNIYLNEQDYTAAVKAYEQAIGLKADEAQAYYNLGYASYLAENLPKAAEAFARFTALKPNDADAHFLLGHILYTLNRHEEAYGPLKKSIELKPDADAFYSLGLVAYSLGKYAESVATFAKSYELKPDAEAQFNLATAYYRLGQYTDAAVSYQKAIDSGLDEEDKATATYNLGHTYYNLARYEAAAAAFSQAVQLKPADAQWYVDLGLAYYKAGRYTDAAEAFKQAVVLKPNNAPAHNNLGYMFYLRDNYSEAINEYRKSIELEPRNAEVYYNLGNANYKQKMYAEALASFKQAVGLKPEQAKAVYMVGTTYYTLGEYGAAEKAFKQATALEPNFAEAYYCLGNSLLMLAAFDDAAATYEKAVSLKIDAELSAKIYYLLGSTYCRLGEYQKAAGAFDQPAIRTSLYRTTNAHVLFNEAVAYNLAKRYREAAESAKLVLQQGIEDEYKPAVYGILGVALAELEQYQKAAAALEQVTSLAPNNEAAHRRLMQTYDMLFRRGIEKDYYLKRARAHLKKLEKINPALANEIDKRKLKQHSH